jgi:hypothetical protein
MVQPSSFRILLSHNNDLYSLCKIGFQLSDASVYLFPYTINRKYYFGGRTMKDTIVSDRFTFTEGNRSENIPKLSLHESGQVHIKSNVVLAGPIFIPPLSNWKGQHLASIFPDSIQSLPKYTTPLKKSGPTIDQVINLPDSLQNIRLALYLSGEKPEFSVPHCQAMIMLVRKTLERPLFIGLNFLAHDQFSNGEFKGVTIIAGWNPNNIRTGTMDYLYIRGL